MARPADAAWVCQQVLASAKYRSLNRDFAWRISAEAASRCRDRYDAVKYAKRKLHQAVGAFVSGSPGEAVRSAIRAIGSGVPARDACLMAMGSHASTAERIPWLDVFYRQIEAWCGRPRSVVDLGCGLNPLALPWMALAAGASYWCCDVDSDLVAAVPGLSDLFAAEVRAEARDLPARPGAPSADVALLLKTLNTLEQQRPGATHSLLAALDSPQVVLSLPRGSLSARRRYSDDPMGLVGHAIAGTPYDLSDHTAFGDEFVCLLARTEVSCKPASDVASRAADR
jgi:16S rRNA (guanine(1405)-N(7))-methyltransferase